MAQIKFSALLSAASGKVGDVVFSIWKGRPYVRNRVTPANPQSDKQTNVRDYMSIFVAWWTLLSADLKAYIKVLAAPESISAFNAFTKRCMRDVLLKPEPINARFVPVSTDVVGLEEITAVTGSGASEIDVTWTDPGSAETSVVEFYGTPMNGAMPTQELERLEKDDILVSAETATFTMAKASQTYRIYALLKTADGPATYAMAVADDAISKS